LFLCLRGTVVLVPAWYCCSCAWLVLVVVVCLFGRCQPSLALCARRLPIMAHIQARRPFDEFHYMPGTVAHLTHLGAIQHYLSSIGTCQPTGWWIWCDWQQRAYGPTCYLASTSARSNSPKPNERHCCASPAMYGHQIQRCDKQQQLDGWVGGW
jgi:hypothetical protein